MTENVKGLAFYAFPVPIAFIVVVARASVLDSMVDGSFGSAKALWYFLCFVAPCGLLYIHRMCV